MELSLIAAVAENNVIGNKGHIPWKIEEDKLHFKQLTMGHIIIMGYNTYKEIYDSIQKPLPGRITIIVSSRAVASDHNHTENWEMYDFENCYTELSSKAAIQKAQKLTEIKPEILCSKPDIFIAGGASLYENFINSAKKLYLTKIHAIYEGDIGFPLFNKSLYYIVDEQNLSGKDLLNGKLVSFSFITLQKN